MIIGIDARTKRKNKSGIGYLIDNLIFAMIDLDKKNQYRILGGDPLMRKANVRVFTLPGILQRGLNLLWKKIFFPSANFILGKVDLFIFTGFVDFPIKAKNKILMIHDVSFIKYPQFTEKKNLAFLKRGVLPSIKRADFILTISENAKKEIIEHYKIDPQKVGFIHLAPNDGIKKNSNQAEIESSKRKYGIVKNYILFVGTVEPRKNIKNLILGYNKLSDELKSRHQLVIAGGKGWYCDEIFELIKKEGCEHDIIFTGYLGEEDLSNIYSGAFLFVMPSFYEGFGIPILEAFKCGVPVISSNTSSLPEVGGNAARYFNPSNIDEIRDSINEILTDEEKRLKMIRDGYERLKEFSWERAANEVFKIINNLDIKC